VGGTNPMLWVGYPKSYTKGRIRPVRFVTLHYTAGSEGPSSAESGAQYDKVRTDGTSCTAFFDSHGPGLQEVPFGDRSHTAFYKGNTIGVHFEICGTRQTRDQWLDPVSLATLQTCAIATRYTCETLGLDWRRRLSVAETRRAWDVGDITGINDHYDCTRAFPEDGGDHTDVGPDFPWDIFMWMVAGTTSTQRKPRGDQMQFISVPPSQYVTDSDLERVWGFDDYDTWVTLRQIHGYKVPDSQGFGGDPVVVVSQEDLDAGLYGKYQGPYRAPRAPSQGGNGGGGSDPVFIPHTHEVDTKTDSGTPTDE